MGVDRTVRLNSLLKEVISEVIAKDVRNPHVAKLFTVTRVSISKDLRHAKVYVSVIGSQEEKDATIKALQTSSGFIAVNSSQKMKIRYFPDLRFFLDDSVDKHMRIEELLGEITAERQTRSHEDDKPGSGSNDGN